MQSSRWLVALPATFMVVLAACSLALGIDDRELISKPSGFGGEGGAAPIQGPACEKADDCPGEDTPCLTRTCDGHCGAVKAPAGTVLPEAFQSLGDCTSVVCDEDGGVTMVPADPPDPPTDGKQCTKDACTSDTPSNPPEASGTACSEGTGIKCDGAGHCVECTVQSDCAAMMVCQGGSCVPAHCANMMPDDDETDIDCGGACAPCDAGKKCVSGADCKSQVCDASMHCKAPACDDGVANGTETDIDCGGGGCPKCAVGYACVMASDCKSSSCVAGKCAPSCTDGVQDNNETDVDCGFNCPQCGVGQHCSGPADCQTGVCFPNVCCAPISNPCANGCGMQSNGCGSFVQCAPCGSVVSSSSSSGPGPVSAVSSSVGPGSSSSSSGGCMFDSAIDGNETDVDCGGGMCPQCGLCKMCNTNADCKATLGCDSEKKCCPLSLTNCACRAEF